MEKRERRAQAGFTLVELMVVIAIIAILATLVGYKVMNAFDDASVAQAKAQIRQFKTALLSYRLKYNHYPSTAEGLDALVKNDKNISFLDSTEVPKDPWGNPYVYSCDGSRDFRIISYGADGKEGGSEIDADIDSSQLEGSR